ncbi:MAG TPA: universal stress protein [Gemmatimonadaceae bacterium]
MAYKSILVHVDESDRSVTRLDVAIELAKSFDAHLAGLALVPIPKQPVFLEVQYGPELAAVRERATREMLDPLKARFTERARRAGLESFEWREASGDVIAHASLHARYADLVVLGQVDPDDARTQVVPGFLEELVLGAGRPLLIVPYAGTFTRIGERALVAWNASCESTRAVTDALPLLARASEVTVLTIDPDTTVAGRGGVPGADIALFLARHGVKAEAARTASDGVSVGNVILSRAADLGADLIVMGAWGHSRVRELVMGGATRTLLGEMTVPVLMSH